MRGRRKRPETVTALSTYSNITLLRLVYDVYTLHSEHETLKILNGLFIKRVSGVRRLGFLGGAPLARPAARGAGVSGSVDRKRIDLAPRIKPLRKSSLHSCNICARVAAGATLCSKGTWLPRRVARAIVLLAPNNK